GFRFDSAIAYVTPTMNGFQAAIAYLNKNSGGLNTNATRDVNGNLVPGTYGKNGWDLGAWYNNGPLGVGFSVNKGLDGGKTTISWAASTALATSPWRRRTRTCIRPIATSSAVALAWAPAPSLAPAP
ncbi:MAG: porin, partial [Ottowia sp.]|nr:porin [Ottowia sp.]